MHSEKIQIIDVHLYVIFKIMYSDVTTIYLWKKNSFQIMSISFCGQTHDVYKFLMRHSVCIYEIHSETLNFYTTHSVINPNTFQRL